MKFGKELRKRRIASSLSRAAFAQKTDISMSRVVKLEQDFKPETIVFKNAIKISETLAWDMKDIAKTIRPYIKWRRE